MKNFHKAIEDSYFIKNQFGSMFLELDNGYEVWLEKLIFDDQYYLAIYKDKELVTDKIVIKPGK